MPVKKLRDFLDINNIRYLVIHHSPAYTAQEVAASAHVKGQEMAKTVIVKLDSRMVMAVLPASHEVDFARIKAAAGVRDVSLATEQEFKSLFPDCAVGAMPPFGNLYGMEVFVSRALIRNRDIAFNGCSYSEMIKLAFEDYRRLVNPNVADFSVPRERRAAA